MKKDITALDKMLGMLSNDAIELAVITESINALKSSAEQNAQDIETKDLSKLKDISYKEVYIDFYRYMKETLSDLEAIIDEIGKSSNNVDSERREILYEKAKIDYDNTIERFNTFVSQR